MTANEQLWQEERASRRQLAKRAAILFIFLFLILVVLSLWISQPLFGKHDTNVELVDASRLQTSVEKLSGEFYPRNHQNLKNLNLSADHIRSEFEKTGGKVSEQAFSVNGSEYRNIILNLGKDGTERIVIGAHYDAAYDTHGADDNASGIAGLIELAHVLSREQHNIPIELVAYSLEEPPFFGSVNMGSYVHAKSLFDTGIRVRLMVCLEMIGYYADDANTQHFPLILGQLLYPSTGNFIALVGNFSNATVVRNFKFSMTSIEGLDTHSLNAPSFIGGVDLSDHRSYWQFGYDALLVTDTAFYRNKAYHTVGDTADRLDYVKMAKVIDAVNVGILDAAK